jgi:hypothetical protein
MIHAFETKRKTTTTTKIYFVNNYLGTSFIHHQKNFPRPDDLPYLYSIEKATAL